MPLDPRIPDLIVRYEELCWDGPSPPLEELCRDCPELIDQLRQHLAVLSQTNRLLKTLAGSSGSVADSAPGLAPTAPSGPISTQPQLLAMSTRYGELKYVTHGGMGELWEARDETLGRSVALKLMLPKYQSAPGAAQRFLCEAEITSQLDHPGIAPVHGVGSTADGRPCYAMRFIHGETLADAIGRFHGETTTPLRGVANRFDTLAFRQLLGRFVAVCNTIAYAHSRGIIHRDLKPQNIRLGQFGETVVLDWGLARPIDAGADGLSSSLTSWPVSPADDPAQTAPGLPKGTPAFMSPEQAVGAWDRVGPASDIFSLGATLYAILTGRQPFVGRGAEAVLQQAAAGSFVLPRRVQPQIPPALEAICVKAMALRAEQRYGAAGELAGEIERWLADEPVAAYGEPMQARAWRWLRRHRAFATAAAALVLATLVGTLLLAVVLDQNRRTLLAEQARTAAEQARANEASAARDAASQTATRSRVLNDFFVQHLLSGTQPEQVGKKGFLEDVLERATAQLDPTAPDHAEKLALLRHNLGSLCWQLGLRAEAELHLRTALDLYRQRFGLAHQETLLALNNLGTVLQDQGKLAEAETLLRQALEGTQRLRGADHPETLTPLHNLAALLYELGKLEEAEPIMRDEVTACRKLYGPDHYETLLTMQNLAVLLRSRGKAAEAEPLAREVVASCNRVLNADNELTMAATNNLALIYRHLGRVAEADAQFSKLLDTVKRVLGPSHPNTLTVQHNVSQLRLQQRQYASAAELGQEVLKLRLQLLKADHPDTGRSQALLGQIKAESGEPILAEALLKEALSTLQKSLPANHPTVAETRGSLGACLVKLERYAEAEPLLLESERTLSAGQSDAALRVISTERLVALYSAWKKPEQAVSWQGKLERVKASPR